MRNSAAKHLVNHSNALHNAGGIACIIALIGAAAVLSGCGSTGSADPQSGSGSSVSSSSETTGSQGTAVSSDSAPTSAASQSAASGESLEQLLPAKYKEAGKIVFGTTKSNPPWSLYDVATGEFSGFEPTLERELAKRLGVTAEIVGSEYAGLQTGLLAGKYDVMISSMHDTLEREKVMDFLDYAKVGSAFITLKGNPSHIEDLASLCGKSVIVAASSVQYQLVEDYQPKCKEAGTGAIEMTTLPDQASAIIAVQSGKADAFFNDKANLVYLASTAPGTPVEVASNPASGIGSSFVGMAAVKSNNDLVVALQGALQSMIDDGSYASLLAKYEFSYAAVEKAYVNGTSTVDASN